mmetsp:Transcript_25649/g.56248  ORF Transcript_25649/g.56248 Transcript_25649/m.56248 type:complete len:204 (+) Transcript_25649:537-1148(+)
MLYIVSSKFAVHATASVFPTSYQQPSSSLLSFMPNGSFFRNRPLRWRIVATMVILVSLMLSAEELKTFRLAHNSFLSSIFPLFAFQSTEQATITMTSESVIFLSFTGWASCFSCCCSPSCIIPTTGDCCCLLICSSFRFRFRCCSCSSNCMYFCSIRFSSRRLATFCSSCCCFRSKMIRSIFCFSRITRSSSNSVAIKAFPTA